MGDIIIDYRNNQKRKNHFFGIGIDAYEHMPYLHNPVKDVEDVANMLTSYYHFEEEHVLLLKNENATRKNIINRLIEYLRKLNEPIIEDGKDAVTDNLIIYFAGHGVEYPATREGYWLPVEASKDDPSGWISVDDVVNKIRPMKAHHVFLIVDSCFSGKFVAQGRSSGITHKYDKDHSRFVITSGDKHIVADGQPGTNSPFAQSILNCLRMHEEPFTASTLTTFVKNSMWEFPQKPLGQHLFIEGNEFGEFVFYRKEMPEPEEEDKVPEAELPNVPEIVVPEVEVDTSEPEEQPDPETISTPSLDHPYLKKIGPEMNSEVKSSPLQKEEEHPFLESLGLEMIKVEGGSFMMGDNSIKEEKPRHRVNIKDFYLGKYPVTQRQWRKVMGSNPSYYKKPSFLKFEGTTYHPVEWVTWEKCKKFIHKLNKRTGLEFRLPSEAEWEFAARGGNFSQGFIYAGSNDLDKVGWNANNAGKWTHPVGKLEPNELGFYDLSGNVWEWCEDDWHPNFEGAPRKGEARVKQKREDYRVIRGGSLKENSIFSRITNRNKCLHYRSYSNVGFRLCRT